MQAWTSARPLVDRLQGRRVLPLLDDRARRRTSDLLEASFDSGSEPRTEDPQSLGAIFDPNNSCLDGGACDIASVYSIADANHDAFVMRSLAEIVGALRVVIARAFGIQLPELAQSYEQDFMMFSLGEWVKREVEKALAVEGRDTLTLDRRIGEVLGGEKSLPELMQIFQQYSSYLTGDDYA